MRSSLPFGSSVSCACFHQLLDDLGQMLNLGGLSNFPGAGRFGIVFGNLGMEVTGQEQDFVGFGLHGFETEAIGGLDLFGVELCFRGVVEEAHAVGVSVCKGIYGDAIVSGNRAGGLRDAVGHGYQSESCHANTHGCGGSGESAKPSCAC